MGNPGKVLKILVYPWYIELHPSHDSEFFAGLLAPVKWEGLAQYGIEFKRVWKNKEHEEYDGHIPFNAATMEALRSSHCWLFVKLRRDEGCAEGNCIQLLPQCWDSNARVQSVVCVETPEGGVEDLHGAIRFTAIYDATACITTCTAVPSLTCRIMHPIKTARLLLEDDPPFKDQIEQLVKLPVDQVASIYLLNGVKSAERHTDFEHITAQQQDEPEPDPELDTSNFSDYGAPINVDMNEPASPYASSTHSKPRARTSTSPDSGSEYDPSADDCSLASKSRRRARTTLRPVQSENVPNCISYLKHAAPEAFLAGTIGASSASASQEPYITFAGCFRRFVARREAGHPIVELQKGGIKDGIQKESMSQRQKL
jgi:hypothetical protein